MIEVSEAKLAELEQLYKDRAAHSHLAALEAIYSRGVSDTANAAPSAQTETEEP